MEIFNCKYFTYLFHVEGGDLSPYSSKKQRSVAPASLSWRI